MTQHRHVRNTLEPLGEIDVTTTEYVMMRADDVRLSTPTIREQEHRLADPVRARKVQLPIELGTRPHYDSKAESVRAKSKNRTAAGVRAEGYRLSLLTGMSQVRVLSASPTWRP